MNKLEFIARQLARTNNKRYENYAIQRMWHNLDNTQGRSGDIPSMERHTPDERMQSHPWF